MLVELPVIFHSNGVALSGRFLRNTRSLDDRQKAVVIIGSWLTVKEQMATTYARRLAERGYTAFIFDTAGFGESEGEPRQAEIAARKIGDIAAVATFLRTVAFVDSDRIGCLAICAGAQYALRAIADGVAIRSFASVAGWYHDPQSIAPFYGGETGVAARVERASQDISGYIRTGEVTMVPAYREGDDRAGMFFNLDYYGRTDRGAVPQWRNEMAEMSWFYWLTYDGMSAADRVTTPSLFVHGDGCVFPDHVKQVRSGVRAATELVWEEGTQTDFYDQPGPVDTAVDAAARWFEKTL